ncbi:LytR/AlgR family response regulator transcription factor [Algoriphagus sediminis]|uniref:LytTR family DNA-binding domain-containing protein n=1 Tax=Algoriphagus sediminis TaxID=3057113 RepID=A0ABT7Y8Z3_9BACT|nr:LytTR family DNA-binding domain-containing protein [Algoriphagus sediminis]MDN3202969.1 LytTR family DNA-binding domain-containing protein [Algoriphagus sediminis]
MTKENHQISYAPDIKIFLILIPLISAFNYFLTYSYIAFDLFTLVRYSVDTAQGFIAWWLVRTIIIWLDTKIPFMVTPLKRTVIQVTLTSVCGLAFIIFTTELLSLLVYGKPAVISFYTLDVLIILIWFFVINGIYIGLLLFQQLKKSNEPSESLERIMVSVGKQKKLFSTDEIIAFGSDSGYVELLTTSGEKFLLDQSLDYWESRLSKVDFFRINRKRILSRKVILGFESKENGKLEIKVSASINQSELGVSRAKAPSFKRWFRPKP